MRLNKRSIVIAALVSAAALTNMNQAYALNDDEAAVLMGLAVGGITAYAVKHHREHDRNGWNVTPRPAPRYRPPTRSHFNSGSPKRFHHKGPQGNFNAHHYGRYHQQGPRIIERRVVYIPVRHHHSKKRRHPGQGYR
ncbi:hypothetical protein FT643_05980 [Ketobacter sp. MCCC 1A13808]|uniref:hypothetical protein n=1 Tax=Ketobacter sp. MCCC 1A13808 TaxID=2602738 RepID=UPI000F1BB4D7|nr:hypothetical protein [Ketobacter sp. MCCC 1A13808]MVF11690.1 hypothetical protein [Ketobacter sp. MCCC 1A13808]RLP55303.1 MAG: hypothetical protein D6160_06010 [Ketobacter sp.]